MSKVLYLIGSLRNPAIPVLADKLRKAHDVEVFDDWFAAGPDADDAWKRYEQERGRTYEEALEGYAAKNVFNFDRFHLDRATHVLLVLPAGKSGHMEIMYATYGAKNKPKTAILLDEEDVRWDVMYQFVPTVIHKVSALGDWLGDTTLEDQLIARGRPEPWSNANGRWPTGLLPKCAGGSVTTFTESGGQTSPWGATPLGSYQEHRSS